MISTFRSAGFLGVIVSLLMLASLPARSAPLQIRTMSQKAYPAKYDLANPAKPGICLEIIRAIERVDPGLRFSGLNIMASTSRAIDYLYHDDIDVFFGMLKTRRRAAAAEFAAPPLFFVPQVLVVRKDDPVQVHSWEDLKGPAVEHGVLVVANSGQAASLHAMNGVAVDDSAFTVAANLKKLLARRGRFVYVSENNAQATIRTLGVTDRVRILRPTFLKADPIYVAFSKKAASEIKLRILAALRKLESSGELARIRTRYLRAY